jgi:hypothetical protein
VSTLAAGCPESLVDGTRNANCRARLMASDHEKD